ncbi:MAG: DNA methylase [Oscillospiraceae bacterium]|nr:DNA methylase [Oscillospiraceae bacterium]
MKTRSYLAIDLKSYYASVECVERGLDPLKTNLVVADQSRTAKTICLAVSPSLKAYGISGRARLFEVVRRVEEVNAERRRLARIREFTGKSSSDDELKADPTLEVDYIVAPPRMAHYMKISTEIYQIYLKYVAPEDIIVYSIDEVMIDVTNYLGTYKLTPREMARQMVLDVLRTTGITAAAGIGTNLYLCKVAMDIVAKHVPADADGVRIAELDEMQYRRLLWDHRPLTDFWRVGQATRRKLEKMGLYTMGDVARCSLGKETDFYNEDLLYNTFGINAELLIDHAWGWEPCTIADIKAYRPESNSLSSGQVLQTAYTADRARIVAAEMADSMVLDLVSKRLVTDQMVLTIVYDTENLTDPVRAARYKGPVVTDPYGRKAPKSAHGSVNLGRYTSSTKLILEKTRELYDRIVDPELLVRRIYIGANHVKALDETLKPEAYEQLDLFSDPAETAREKEKEEKERRLQETMLELRQKYGKNTVLKGTSYREGATARERNRQIGGHKA